MPRRKKKAKAVEHEAGRLRIDAGPGFAAGTKVCRLGSETKDAAAVDAVRWRTWVEAEALDFEEKGHE